MSVFKPATLTLSDGATVSVRTPEEADAERMLAYLDDVRRETPFLMFAPDDDLPTVEWERDWIRGRREGQGVQILVEDDPGQVVALCGIEPGRFVRSRHCGTVGISIRAAWCGRGLGTALMRELIRWAERSPELDVLQLGVFADNPRAQHLYEKVGFEVTGRARRAIKQDGRHFDEVMMSRWVGPESQK